MKFLFKNFLLYVILCIFLACESVQDAEKAAMFYVAQNGSDLNNGTIDKPYKTIMKARDAARSVKTEKPRKIILRGGAYYEVEVVLEPVDSGLTIEAAPGETPVLYGGRMVTNWEKDGDFYAAKLEGVKDRTWDFRLILVNDEMRPRARLPKTGAFEHLSRFNVPLLRDIGWERKFTDEELTTLKYKIGDLGPWLDVRNAELTIFHSWDESLVGLKSLDDKKQTVTFSVPAGYPTGSFYVLEVSGGHKYIQEKAKTYIVWNIREGMNEPGQWYLDRTEEKLVYWPMPGEDISKINVITPTKETVIRIENETKDITLKGLTVSCTKTPLITGGFGASRFNGAISGKGINNCRFINLTVKNVSGFGINTYGNNILIEGCETKNTGAGGIKFDGENVKITRNHIHDVGVIYYSATGINGGGKKNEISHNEVHGTPYSGICGVGDMSIVEGNFIYDVMKILNDGANIYIGGSNYTIIRGNIAHGGRAEDRIGREAVSAYYLDESCMNCIVEKNLSLNSVWPILFHADQRCIIRNNIFIDKGSQFLIFTLTTGTIFEKNILIADEIEFQTRPDGITSMPNNILFSRSNKINDAKLKLYDTIKTLPLEPRDGTIFADPQFVDWENENYNFKPDSPALKLGIEPIDVSTAGIIDVKK